MRLRSSPLIFVCLMIVFPCAPLFAQDPAFHAELVPDGTNGQLMIIINSEKPIEAYSFLARCWNGPSLVSRVEWATDRLNNIFDERPLVAPGSRKLRPGLSPQTQSCEWKGEFNAIIYSDGTYGGDESVVRRLQAYRDGIEAGLKYWLDRFYAADGEKPDLYTVQAAAQGLNQQDSSSSSSEYHNGMRLASSYLDGRSKADFRVAEEARRQTNSPEETYTSLVAVITRWQQNLDRDVALKKLDAIFPLPPSLAAQGH